MTLQEQQMIDELVGRIRSTQLTEKDPAAEQRLQQGLAGYPDAVYVLAQTVLVQKYGLEQAQQQLQSLQAENDQLQQQLQAPPPAPAKAGGSFLGNLFGGPREQPQPQSNPAPGYANAPGQYPPSNNQGYPPYPEPGYPAYPQQPYPPQAYPPPPYGQPAGYGPPMGGGGGGFLRSAMQTAAGVAAGEMMFQGMESLFHGFGGGHQERGFGDSRPGEVVNNYYGEDEGHEHHHEAGAGHDDGSFYDPHHDASRDESGGRDAGESRFADTDNDGDGSDDDGDDASGNDDYDSGDDDGSSSDDSGN